jgi:hypothetical protein
VRSLVARLSITTVNSESFPITFTEFSFDFANVRVEISIKAKIKSRFFISQELRLYLLSDFKVAVSVCPTIN